MDQTLQIDHDAFSDGQIGSKIWLCETLEDLQADLPKKLVIWTLGGWYGLMAFLIFSRDRLKPAGIRSFDQDSKVEHVADRLNNHWQIQEWKFKAHTLDVNHLDFRSEMFGSLPNLVINTSCEHFDSLEWWAKIPPGTYVALQATDMVVDDHVARVKDLKEMKTRFCDFQEILFSGERSFAYPGFRFTRFMIVGIK